MPTRPGFLQPKPKIDEAEWAETQARTVRRLHAFFSPELAAAEAEAEAAAQAAAESQAGVAVADEGHDSDASAEARPGLVVSGIGDPVEAEPRPIVVYDGTAEIASIPLPEPLPEALPASEAIDGDLLDALEAGGRSRGDHEAPVVGVMAPMDDLGWDDDRPLMGVFEAPDQPVVEASTQPEADSPDQGPDLPDAVAIAADVEPVQAMRPADAPRPAKAPRTRAARAKARPARPAGVKVAPKAATPKRAATKPASTVKAATPAASKPVPKSAATPSATARPGVAVVAHCPYCATVLDPAPTSNRRCERCRHRIMVKKVNGAAVYLTEAALQVFDAERKRVSNLARWTKERDRWLRLAATVGAPEERRVQLAKARLTDDVVATSRKLYVNNADRAYRAARAKQDWVAAGRLRREKAVALHAGAGSPVPPSEEVVAIFREGVAAELRGISEIARDAQLVSGKCCEACTADEGSVVRIARELKAPRLPHAGCPRGLCRCHWDLAEKDRLTVRRYLRRRSGSE